MDDRSIPASNELIEVMSILDSAGTKSFSLIMTPTSRGKGLLQ